MTEAERIARKPSDATLRMAKILGTEWIPCPKWQRRILQGDRHD